MECYDINLVADLNAHDPDAPNPGAPVESDGTGTPTENQLASTNPVLEPLAIAITPAWEVVNFWPWLVLSFIGNSIDLVFKVDLLGNTQLNTLAISIPVIEALTQTELEQTAEEVDEAGRFLFSFTVPFIIGQILLQGLKLLENMSFDVPKMLLGLVGWLILWQVYVTILLNLVADGALHPFGVAYNFLGIAFSMFPGLRSGISMAGSLVATLQKYRLGDLLESAYGSRVKSAIWTTIIAFFKIFILVSCIALYVQLIVYGFSM